MYYFGSLRPRFRLILPTLISPTMDQFVSFCLLNIELHNNNWFRHSKYVPSDILGLEYRIALNFCVSLISWISQIFNCSRKLFQRNFWYAACTVRVQQIRKIISTKFSKIAICENLDPQKFSTVRYAVGYFLMLYQKVKAAASYATITHGGSFWEWMGPKYRW